MVEAKAQGCVLGGLHQHRHSPAHQRRRVVGPPRGVSRRSQRIRPSSPLAEKRAAAGVPGLICAVVLQKVSRRRAAGQKLVYNLGVRSIPEKPTGRTKKPGQSRADPPPASRNSTHGTPLPSAWKSTSRSRKHRLVQQHPPVAALAPPERQGDGRASPCRLFTSSGAVSATAVQTKAPSRVFVRTPASQALHAKPTRPA
jgi:hypothetical protein